MFRIRRWRAGEIAFWNLNGYGYLPGQTVDLFWDVPRKRLGKATANTKGSFGPVTVTIPSTTQPGPNRVFGQGYQSGVGVGHIDVQ